MQSNDPLNNLPPMPGGLPPMPGAPAAPPMPGAPAMPGTPAPQGAMGGAGTFMPGLAPVGGSVEQAWKSPELIGSGPQERLEDIHIDELLHHVVDLGSSDLHLCVGSAPIVRLDGGLKRLNYDEFAPNVIQRMLYEILSDDNIKKFETTLELDFSYQLPRRARFRVNIYREKGALAAAFRLIPQRIPTVEELNLPPILKKLTEKPRGLILVTGPTGSGKSTSLAAMINHINETRDSHIITIEDPIEYLHQHKNSIINQRELGGDTRAFSNALRACLREDPDVLLVGEMRDVETISLAITAAETGHLVFATLHTNNAAESVDRMIDVFPPGQQEQIRVQLSNNIQAIISQQLLPKASGKGRVPANEIMIASPAIRNLIREGKTHQIMSMIQTSGGMGMITMDQCLRDLFLKGQVTQEEIFIRCQNPDELKKMLALGGPGGPGQPGAGPGGAPGAPQRGR
ncbi:MAG: type IV pilus twitching motility protein PilT [Armatimonadetes bacterium]|nr:type IV pilus twitching motility protein PilT [Armatimonadota bacterium]